MNDYIKAVFGQHAARGGAWMYIQHQGDGIVSFVGSSRVPEPSLAHPFRFGSERTHQFVVGEVLIRPQLVVATDALRGEGLSALATGSHDIDRMLTAGETLFDLRS